MAKYKITAEENGAVCLTRKNALENLADYAQRNTKSDQILASNDAYIISRTEALAFFTRILPSAPYLFSHRPKGSDKTSNFRYVNAYEWCLIIRIDEPTKTIWVEHAEELSEGKTVQTVITSFLQTQ